MVNAIHELANTLRGYCARRTGSYERIEDSDRSTHPENLTTRTHDADADSINFSTKLAPDNPPYQALRLEKLNRETIAFGMVCPNGKPKWNYDCHSLKDIFETLHIPIVQKSEDDSFIIGQYYDTKRPVYISASRDKVGGVAFHIYEQPNTRPEDKVFGGHSDYFARAYIRKAIQMVCGNSMALDDRYKNNMDKNYIIVAHYHDKLASAKRDAEIDKIINDRWFQAHRPKVTAK